MLKRIDDYMMIGFDKSSKETKGIGLFRWV